MPVARGEMIGRFLTVPGLPTLGGAVTATPLRDSDVITAELDGLRRLMADTASQLLRVRHTIAEKQREIGLLEVHEFNLVVANDARARKADRLLDEMLTRSR